ncbi:ATP-binding protein [Litoreibacter roseus]|uniref:histidine kinase n=1 Tax=Litoreibacter roseus TaxID=2601869 RepID=A0A6N6JE53_9RHOB|nr:ATP-binding protein [Litoreibacter roseus]GFE64110.1 two-component sensor histidine kinase [Litoreibacter roseus]
MARFSIKRYLPRSLYGRAALILLVPVITIQLVVSFAFIQRLYEDVTEQMTDNLSVGIRYLLSEFRTGGPDAMQDAADALQMELTYPGGPVGFERRFFDLSGRVIERQLTESFPALTGVDLVDDRKRVLLGIETGEGLVEISFPRRRVTATNPHQLLVWMVLTGGLMTFVAYQFLRNQLRPIRRLARAAEAFGKGQSETYHPSGAVEVRSAGNAFLNMRSRIERQIEQRTLMLSGVSHDLRTPLTRLKLGLSMQPDTEDTRALIADVDEMEALIAAFLDFARSDAIEDLEPSDPVAVVRAVVDKAQRAGRNVVLKDLPHEPATLTLRPLAIARAVDNLVGNAVRYGTKAAVSVDLLTTALRIRVEDDGPGIPAENRDEALKPFARLDAARNQNAGSGVGLGLAIAADITRSHGGTLRLGESEALGGLSAEIVLPR